MRGPGRILLTFSAGLPPYLFFLGTILGVRGKILLAVRVAAFEDAGLVEFDPRFHKDGGCVELFPLKLKSAVRHELGQHLYELGLLPPRANHIVDIRAPEEIEEEKAEEVRISDRIVELSEELDGLTVENFLH